MDVFFDKAEPLTIEMLLESIDDFALLMGFITREQEDIQDSKMNSPIFMFLQQHFSAAWDSSMHSIELKKKYGNNNPIGFAKAELRNAPLGENSKRRKLEYKIYHRPRAMVTDSTHSHAWVHWTTLEDTLDTKKEIPAILEKLALYDALVPHFIKTGQTHYVDAPDNFYEDIGTFLAISEETLKNHLDSEKIGYIAFENIHLQVLEMMTGERGRCHFTLDKLLSQINNPKKIATNVESKMPAETFTQKMMARAKEGMITGAIGQLNRRSIQLVTEQPACPDFLKTEIGQKVLEGAIPMGVLFMLQTPYGANIPPALRSKVEALANRAFDSFSQDSASKLLDVGIDTLGPMLQDWIEAAKTLDFEELETPAPALAQAAPTTVSAAPVVRERQVVRSLD